MAASTLLVVYASLAVFSLYFVARIVWRAHFSPLSKIPGPYLARYTNLMLKWNVIRGSRTGYIHSLHEQYGPMVRLTPNEVGVADLSASKQIHNVSKPFLKSSWYRELTPFEDQEHGVFSMIVPQECLRSRKLFAQALSKGSVYKWEDHIKRCVDLVIQKIKRDASTGSADILKWWTFMTIDVLGEVAFGESFQCLEQEQKSQFIKDLETVMVIASIQVEFPTLTAIVRRLPIPPVQQVFGIYKRLNDYGAVAVRSAKGFNVHGSSLKTTMFAKMTDSSGKLGLADAQIAQEAGNIMIAGSDTTALTLTYLVWTVLRNPSVKQTLLAELKASNLGSNPSGLALERLPYLCNVIEETLRLHPSVPSSLPRSVPAGGAELAGYAIPGGITVSTQAYTFHRDPTIFPHPMTFDPSRWENPTPRMREAFMTFGAGARACQGVALARLELLHAVYRFFVECGDEARVAEGFGDEMMDMEDYFLGMPKAHRCEITMVGS